MTDEELRTALSAWSPPRLDANQFKSAVWQRIGRTEPVSSPTNRFRAFWEHITHLRIGPGLAFATLAGSAILAFTYTREIKCTVDSLELAPLNTSQLNGELKTQIKLPTGPAN